MKSISARKAGAKLVSICDAWDRAPQAKRAELLKRRCVTTPERIADMSSKKWSDLSAADQVAAGFAAISLLETARSGSR